MNTRRTPPEPMFAAAASSLNAYMSLDEYLALTPAARPKRHIRDGIILTVSLLTLIAIITYLIVSA